nr:hypothetical protein [Tanacetum cinerariifolium]
MMADQRTMAQLLQAPTEGYEDAIVVPAITADNFELKHAQIWLEKEPPRLIFTWDDLVLKFINQFFPPSKTTNLPNKITNFQQRFDESFSEAWNRFKDLLRACPHHDKMPRECIAIIESKSKVRYSHNKPVVAKVSTNTSTSGISPEVAELKDMVKALLLDKKSQNQAPATVKAIEESCVTCGGAHSYRNCPATDGNVYRDNIQGFIYQASAVNYNQGNTSYRPLMMSNQIRTPDFLPEDFPAYVKANNAVMRNMQTQGQNMQNQLTNLTDLLTKFVNSNNASTSSSGTLPSNTIVNPRRDLKEITTQSGVSYDGPQILPPTSFLPKVVQSKSPILTSELVNSPTIEPINSPFSAPRPNQRPLIPYPSRIQDQKLRDKDNDQPLADLGASINLMPLYVWNKLSLLDLSPTCMTLELADRSISRPVGVAEDVYVKVGKLTLRVDKEAITFNLDQTSRYSANYNDMTAKRINVIDMACEEYSHEVMEVDQSYLDSEGDILLLEAFLNDDPSLPLPNQGNCLPKVCKELNICEAKSDKSSIDEPTEVKLKDIPPHLEYTFLEGDNKLPVIIAKDLSVEEKIALITVLKSHKLAIAWKLSNIKASLRLRPGEAFVLLQIYCEIQKEAINNDSDDGEVLNELIKYENVGMLRREKEINSFDRDDLAFKCMIGFMKFVAYFDPFLPMNIITCKADNTIMVEGLESTRKNLVAIVTAGYVFVGNGYNKKGQNPSKTGQNRAQNGKRG